MRFEFLLLIVISNLTEKILLNDDMNAVNLKSKFIFNKFYNQNYNTIKNESYKNSWQNDLNVLVGQS